MHCKSFSLQVISLAFKIKYWKGWEKWDGSRCFYCIKSVKNSRDFCLRENLRFLFSRVIWYLKTSKGFSFDDQGDKIDKKSTRLRYNQPHLLTFSPTFLINAIAIQTCIKMKLFAHFSRSWRFNFYNHLLLKLNASHFLLHVVSSLNKN